MPASSSGKSSGFAAFRSRNYRLYFVGQGVSLTGTFLQTVALSWLVYRTTGSKMLLGTLAFANQAPSLLFSPVAGALADRWDRKRALVVLQALMALQAAALCLVALHPKTPIAGLILLSFLSGCLNSVDIPFRQSFVHQMLDHPSALPSAIALNSAMFNAARAVGPALGGAVVALLGEPACFALNAASYLAVILALVAIRPNPAPRGRSGRLWSDILEGLAYARSHRPIRDLLLLVSAVGLFGMAYAILLPAYARDLLAGDARTLGFLMGAGGLGAVGGALLLARRPRSAGLRDGLWKKATLAGLALVALANSRSTPLSLVCASLVGFGLISTAGAANTLIQSWLEDRFRGRIMSLYTLAFLGSSTVGSLAMGWMSTHAGVRWSIALAGLSFLACAFLYGIRGSAPGTESTADPPDRDGSGRTGLVPPGGTFPAR